MQLLLTHYKGNIFSKATNSRRGIITTLFLLLVSSRNQKQNPKEGCDKKSWHSANQPLINPIITAE